MSGGGGDPINTSGGTSFSELKTAWTSASNTFNGDAIKLSHFAGKTFITGPSVPAASGNNNINIKGFQYWTYNDAWGTSSSGARTFNSWQGAIGDGGGGGSGSG
tara:strand:- start:13 stop:324 length:312 start_codon:yes stop_codon:yes gene_type:complete